MKQVNPFKLLHSDLLRLYYPSSENEETNKISFIKAFNPRFFPVIIIRLSYFFYQVSILRIFAHLLTWFNVCVFGIESTPKCKIGPGLVIPHSTGTVIGAASIGNNVTIFQGVTLGSKVADMHYDLEIRPKVGNNVVIGAGSKILGKVSVGNNIVIGSNSVVIEDIPDSVDVAGIPAKIIKRKN